MAKRSAFRDTWKDYLSFSKRERRGITALLLIVFLQIVMLSYLNFFPSGQTTADFSRFQNEVDAFYAAVAIGNDSLNGLVDRKEPGFSEKSKTIKKEKQSELFAFNPNNLPTEDWQRLGFSDKQIRVIKNYETKGGKFYSKENVKKMYCISEMEYNRIEPYISIPVAKAMYDEKSKKKFEKPVIVVDIGTADSAELVLLKGIGPSFARRISIYRNKLGGFAFKEQLKEVWGFSDSLYQSLLPEICLKDSFNIKQINLNKADFNEMRNHPYIGYQLSSMISNYRQQHHGFKDLDEIKKLPLVNEQLYSKLAPYLTID